MLMEIFLIVGWFTLGYWAASIAYERRMLKERKETLRKILEWEKMTGNRREQW